MREFTLRGRDVVAFAGTRVALGIGIGLLLGPRLDERVRRRAGWTMAVVGALTTVPIMRSVRARSSGKLRNASAAGLRESVEPGRQRRDASAYRDRPAAR